MRRSFFVDAWFFIASLEPRDEHHRAALRLSSFALDARLLTHEAVLTEVLAYFAGEGAHVRRLAVSMVRSAGLRMDVVTVDRSLFSRGLDLYESRPDKKYSLVDCISMQLMRSRGITHVLTNDHHFRQEGFAVLSDAP
jgi:predicted nucleic acid-binding protein